MKCGDRTRTKKRAPSPSGHRGETLARWKRAAVPERQEESVLRFADIDNPRFRDGRVVDRRLMAGRRLAANRRRARRAQSTPDTPVMPVALISRNPKYPAWGLHKAERTAYTSPNVSGIDHRTFRV